jgi:hypothetical protein
MWGDMFLRNNGELVQNKSSGMWRCVDLPLKETLILVGVETNWFHSALRPTVPAPGDYDDGEIGGIIGRGNRSTWRRPAPVPLCPPQTPHALLGREPGPPRWEASD